MKDEYVYLLRLYTEVVAFPIVAGQFETITKPELQIVLESIKDLKDKLEDVIPKMAQRRDGEIET